MMRDQPLFQGEVTLAGDTGGTTTEFFQAAGLTLDCQDADSVAIEPTIYEKTGTIVDIFIETSMSMTGPWRRFTDALQDGVSFVLSRSDMATHPLYRYVRWVVVLDDSSPPNAWIVNFSATFSVS